jgi:hypothetical protein
VLEDYLHEVKGCLVYYLWPIFDAMMRVYSCDAMKDEFLALYKKDFEITGGSKMETFLGIAEGQIYQHLENYVKEVVTE